MPAPFDGLRAIIRAALTHPDPADPQVQPPQPTPLTPEEQALFDRLSGTSPSALSVALQHPLSEAELVIPVQHDFCAQCQLDLFTNPDTVVLDTAYGPDGDYLLIGCGCGRVAQIPRWLFR